MLPACLASVEIHTVHTILLIEAGAPVSPEWACQYIIQKSIRDRVHLRTEPDKVEAQPLVDRR